LRPQLKIFLLGKVKKKYFSLKKYLIYCWIVRIDLYPGSGTTRSTGRVYSTLDNIPGVREGEVLSSLVFIQLIWNPWILSRAFIGTESN